MITQTGKSVGDDKIFRAYAAVQAYATILLPGMYVSALIEESDD